MTLWHHCDITVTSLWHHCDIIAATLTPLREKTKQKDAGYKMATKREIWQTSWSSLTVLQVVSSNPTRNESRVGLACLEYISISSPFHPRYVQRPAPRRPEGPWSRGYTVQVTDTHGSHDIALRCAVFNALAPHLANPKPLTPYP